MSNDMVHVERLIALAQGAYDETFDWEKSNNRLRVLNWGLIGFNTFLLVWNVVILVRGFSFASALFAVIAVGLVAYAIWLLNSNKEHHDWIMDCRANWEADLRHWQAVKLEWEATGVMPHWFFQLPSRTKD